MEQTCYHVLAVHSDASSAEIRRAFRRQARRCHPDTAPPGAADEAHFQKLLVAYRLLGSPSKRARYDAHLTGARSAVSGSLLRSWRKVCRDRWQWLGALFHRCNRASPVLSASNPYRPPARVRTRSRERSCWSTFGQVLAARQQIESSCYVLCEDGIIRPKSAAGEKLRGSPLRPRRKNLTAVLRGWWVLLLVSCWEVFRR